MVAAINNDQVADDLLLIDTKEAQRRLSISARKLWEITNIGDIPAVRIGKKVLYSLSDLCQWIESKKTRGAK